MSPRAVARQVPWPLVRLDGVPAETSRTSARFARTEEHFIVLFESSASPPLALLHADGQDVFRDECVELFLSTPANPGVYDEIVVSPRGAVYAARVTNPEDSRETWTVSRRERPSGLVVEVAGDPPSGPESEWTTWSCLLTIPWTSLAPGTPPAPGEERRGNATRVARGRSTEYLALSPTFRTNPPDFHVPSRFARFVF